MHNIGFAIEMLHFLYFIALAHTGCELYTFYNEYKNCSNKLMILHIKMGGGGGILDTVLSLCHFLKSYTAISKVLSSKYHPSTFCCSTHILFEAFVFIQMTSSLRRLKV